MPSDRKYNRSRSPADIRTNRHKYEYKDSDERSLSHRSRHRYGYDHGKVNHQENFRDDRRHRDSERSRPSYNDREKRKDELHHYARNQGARRDSQYRRQRSRSRGRTSKDKTDDNYGRLVSPKHVRSPIAHSPVTDAQSSYGHETTKRRKLSVSQETVNGDRDVKRSSRFDEPAPMARESFIDGTTSNGKAKEIEDTRTRPNSDFHEKADLNQASSPHPEEDKLRARQERLAQWKKKKAEEEARRKSEISTIEPAIREAQAIQLLNARDEGKQTISSEQKSEVMISRPSPFTALTPSFVRFSTSQKPSTLIGKFGMTSKPVKLMPDTKATDSLNFDDEEEQEPRSFREVGTASIQDVSQRIPDESTTNGHTIATSQISQDKSDEVDPLDAFMEVNDSSLHVPPTTNVQFSRDVMNGQESEIEAELSEEEDILAAAAKRMAQKKKDFTSVDHSRQNYEAFRKDFYVEPEELAALSEEEVDNMRLGLDGIVIRGKDCPKPVVNWGQCGLSAPILEQIERLGYEHPTSIQAQAIPAIMSGRDTIGVAKTGSGKTVAFLLPMFRHIKDQRPLENMEGPIALILTPTRELAVQIHKECKPFLKVLDLRAVCIYGGPPIKDQIAELKRGAEIVVCTPGRMIDVLAANQGRVTNLKRVTYTVLDEADRMFDLGFEPQVMKIINNVRPQRQTVLFSATFPKSMEALARKILRGKPVEITVGARSVVAPEITQIVEVRPVNPDPQKFNRVLEILGELYNRDEDARTLIFVDRQESADSLLSQLMRKGYPCNALHGGKDQYDRDSTISDFKAGVFPILVATSIAARGLDVKQLKLVINYDCPNHMEDYVHRVGRTGRAGNKGTAITFVGEDQERYAFDVAKALRLSQVDVPETLQKLADAFEAKIKAGQEKNTAAGFGGKGLSKFDTARDKEMKVQRRIFGEEEDVDDAVAATRSAALDEEDANSVDEDCVDPEQIKAVAEHSTSAAADASIKVERTTAQSRKPLATKPNVGTKVLDPLAVSRARIDAINNRIKTGSKPLDQISTNADAGEFRDTMEINDYPQKARWAVTNRANITKVLEATGVSITTQGQYIRPGSSAPAGVRKLYLLIEGPRELGVKDAFRELRRLLAEATMADAEASSTRYNPV